MSRLRQQLQEAREKRDGYKLQSEEWQEAYAMQLDQLQGLDKKRSEAIAARVDFMLQLEQLQETYRLQAEWLQDAHKDYSQAMLKTEQEQKRANKQMTEDVAGTKKRSQICDFDVNGKKQTEVLNATATATATVPGTGYTEAQAAAIHEEASI